MAEELNIWTIGSRTGTVILILHSNALAQIALLG